MKTRRVDGKFGLEMCDMGFGGSCNKGSVGREYESDVVRKQKNPMGMRREEGLICEVTSR